MDEVGFFHRKKANLVHFHDFNASIFSEHFSCSILWKGHFSSTPKSSRLSVNQPPLNSYICNSPFPKNGRPFSEDSDGAHFSKMARVRN